MGNNFQLNRNLNNKQITIKTNKNECLNNNHRNQRLKYKKDHKLQHKRNKVEVDLYKTTNQIARGVLDQVVNQIE